MKSILGSVNKGVLLGCGLLFCTSTMAAHLTIDVKLGETTLGNSGDETEEAWLESLTGMDHTQIVKNDIPGPSVTNHEGAWVIDVAPQEPGYFILKFGNGSTGENSHYAFQNIGELDKLVFTDAQVNGLAGSCTDCSIQRLSHYVIYDPIPIPAAAWLFGSALVGLTAVARRRRQEIRA